ncbi:hypothetical protein V5799_008415 [Amblyomma americanum]|uniref:Ig-like domain-containing protein n=1 Tax=Amblyomma americanum TaxID=6943 RepID=A0AAQ4FEY9_AMBAM
MHSSSFWFFTRQSKRQRRLVSVIGSVHINLSRYAHSSLLQIRFADVPKVGDLSFLSTPSMGEELIVMCVVKKGAVEPYRITWRKDGSELRPTQRLSMSSVFKSSAALRIASLRPEDVGNYSCTATNSFGSDTSSAALLVHGPPKVFEFTFPPEVALGDEILVGCVVKKGAHGPYHFTWQRDGRDLESSDRLSVFGQSRTSVALRIMGVRPEDVGNYTCVASNSFGSDSFTAPLVVHVAPKLQSAGFPAEISLGDDTAAVCLVTKGSSGPFRMAWLKNGKEVGNGDRVTVAVKARTAVLSIEDIRVDDIGNYTCTATNLFGKDALTIPLLVKAPKVGKFGFPPDVALGDEIIETCLVKKGSAGPYRFTLLKDGTEVSSGDRLTVSSHSKSSVTLRIASLRPEDVGNYTCTASNPHGSDSVTAALIVNALCCGRVRAEGKPKLRSSGFSNDLSLGEFAVATCAVKRGASEPLSLSWHMGDREIVSTARVSVDIKTNNAMLTIDSVRVEDVGNYTCTARNAFGSDALTLPLLVSGVPRVGEFSFPSNLAIGEEVIALCVVKKGGAEPYRITWRKDGVELTPSERLSTSAVFKSSAALRIASLRPGDVGNYSCTASNAFGSDSASAPLVVHGNKPLSYQNLTRNKVGFVYNC